MLNIFIEYFFDLISFVIIHFNIRFLLMSVEFHMNLIGFDSIVLFFR